MTFSRMQSGACGSPSLAPGQGQGEAGGCGGDKICARPGPTWEQPLLGPNIAPCHFVLKCFSLSRGVSARCSRCFPRKACFSGKKRGVFFWLSPKPFCCHFSLPFPLTVCGTGQPLLETRGGQEGSVAPAWDRDRHLQWVVWGMWGCAEHPRNSE